MSRKTLEENKVHSSISSQVGGNEEYRSVVDKVIQAVEEHDVVVVGMAHNPYPKKARKLLEDNNIVHHYLEYGNYFSQWHLRGALKMWSGWQTFPMIFIKGQLVGGASDLEQLHTSGELAKLLQ